MLNNSELSVAFIRGPHGTRLLTPPLPPQAHSSSAVTRDQVTEAPLDLTKRPALLPPNNTYPPQLSLPEEAELPAWNLPAWKLNSNVPNQNQPQAWNSVQVPNQPPAWNSVQVPNQPPAWNSVPVLNHLKNLVGKLPTLPLPMASRVFVPSAPPRQQSESVQPISAPHKLRKALPISKETSRKLRALMYQKMAQQQWAMCQGHLPIKKRALAISQVNTVSRSLQYKGHQHRDYVEDYNAKLNVHKAALCDACGYILPRRGTYLNDHIKTNHPDQFQRRCVEDNKLTTATMKQCKVVLARIDDQEWRIKNGESEEIIDIVN